MLHQGIDRCCMNTSYDGGSYTIAVRCYITHLQQNVPFRLGQRT